MLSLDFGRGIFHIGYAALIHKAASVERGLEQEKDLQHASAVKKAALHLWL